MTRSFAHALIVLAAMASAALADSKKPMPPDFPSMPWPAPAGWKTETIPFPLDFAPGLAYRGFEELRFSPGFGKPGDPMYFTYAFLWVVHRDASTRPETIAAQLAQYFDGLMAAVAASKKQEPPPGRAQVTLAPPPAASDAPTWQGTATTHDAFFTQRPLALQLRIYRDRAAFGEWRVHYFEAGPDLAKPGVASALQEVRSALGKPTDNTSPSAAPSAAPSASPSATPSPAPSPAPSPSALDRARATFQPAAAGLRERLALYRAGKLTEDQFIEQVDFALLPEFQKIADVLATALDQRELHGEVLRVLWLVGRPEEFAAAESKDPDAFLEQLANALAPDWKPPAKAAPDALLSALALADTTVAILTAAGVRTVGELAAREPASLLALDGFDDFQLHMVRERLQVSGLKLKGE